MKRAEQFRCVQVRRTWNERGKLRPGSYIALSSARESEGMGSLSHPRSSVRASRIISAFRIFRGFASLPIRPDRPAWKSLMVPHFIDCAGGRTHEL